MLQNLKKFLVTSSNMITNNEIILLDQLSAEKYRIRSTKSNFPCSLL